MISHMHIDRNNTHPERLVVECKDLLLVLNREVEGAKVAMLAQG
jgi:hypothetical protein